MLAIPYLLVAYGALLVVGVARIVSAPVRRLGRAARA
jgi:hypothetical protein